MSLKLQENEISLHFNKGKYEDLLNLVGRAPLSFELDSFEIFTAFQVGALVFLGEFTEAQVLYERALHHLKPSPLFQVRCHFFLGLGCVRRSDYIGAAKHFSFNRKKAKTKNWGKEATSLKEQNEILFYSYQGSAFFRFYKGRFKLAEELATQAYHAAFENQFSFGLVFSLDLLGHSLCRLGYVRRGIFELERALKLAKDIGNNGMVNSITVSLITFKAHFGFNLAQDVLKLKEAIACLDINDVYSRGELYLELIHQFILRGQASEAQHHLDQVASIIYINQNKRQSALFNLRCAQIMMLKGETYAALALVGSLKNNLDARVDIFLLRQVEHLEENIKKRLLSPHFIVPLETRSYFYSIEVNNLGEDPMGDILDQAQKSGVEYFYELKKNGLLGLIPQVLGLPVSFKGIYLGPSRSEVVVFNAGNVKCIDKGVSVSLKKLIQLLEGVEFKSKEFLIKEVWGYEYQPQIHDSLLHSSIGKIRSFLNENSSWIEWSNEGYRLNPHIRVTESSDHKVVAANVVANKGDRDDKNNKDDKDDKDYPYYAETQNSLKDTITPKRILVGLNVRQLKLMKILKSQDYIGVNDYAKRFRVCKMTACRDLSSLHQSGLVIRVGKARATVYGLRELE